MRPSSRRLQVSAIFTFLYRKRCPHLTRLLSFLRHISEVYKDCLDKWLEGLIDGGGALKRQLLESEYKEGSGCHEAVLKRVDRVKIGRILCLHAEFRTTVRDISQLFREIQCMKFVGQNSASSRRRRRRAQQAALERNLSKAVESLTMSSPDTASPVATPDIKSPSRRCSGKDTGKGSGAKLFRSMSSSSIMSAMSDRDKRNETWMSNFYEKEMGRYSRQRPVLRRSSTYEEGCDLYRNQAEMIVPSEESLAVALKRFPLPAAVVGDNNLLLSPNSSFDNSSKRPASPLASPVVKQRNTSDSPGVSPCASLDSLFATKEPEGKTDPDTPTSVVLFKG